MSPALHYFRRVGLAATLAWLLLQASLASNLVVSGRDDLAVVRGWLPNPDATLDLVFSYNPDDPESEPADAAALHKAIDRVGPTVVLLRVRRPYHDEDRIIGGYNPYKWRTWLGSYEESPGLFVFDVDRGKRWFRQSERQGRHLARPSQHGLHFGRGDLAINPDLRTGSAQNRDFGPSGDASVLLSDSGPFAVTGIEVYRVATPEGAGGAGGPITIASFNRSPPGELRPHPVPSSSYGVLELIPLCALLIARFVKRRHM